MCANFQAKWTILTFLAQIWPKIGFWFEIQQTNVEIKIDFHGYFGANLPKKGRLDCEFNKLMLE